MRALLTACFTAALGFALAGCATASKAPASSKTVNRFYRDMVRCFERAHPDAVKTSEFTRYNPKSRVNVVRETVTLTLEAKTEREYRVVFTESPPDTTTITTYPVGRLASAAQIQAETAPLVDGCAARPF